jgi:hypothetical protein
VTGAAFESAFESQIGPRHPDLYSRTNTTVFLGIGDCMYRSPRVTRNRGGFERESLCGVEYDRRGEAKPALCVLRC